ncbi:hypothetical protein BaRGS_00022595 [Batillaria attramentaria]|uniref:Uncharacterized protein n=1 Tax=Batillaria attramentaria TaxID=370345 RepID=A0ABD0KG88_9CAEN
MAALRTAHLAVVVCSERLTLFNPERLTLFRPERRTLFRPERRTLFHPERLTLFNPERRTLFNPERLTLFNPERPTLFNSERRTLFNPERLTLFNPERRTLFSPERPTLFNPERLTLFNPERPALFNPERLTLFTLLSIATVLSDTNNRYKRSDPTADSSTEEDIPGNWCYSCHVTPHRNNCQASPNELLEAKRHVLDILEKNGTIQDASLVDNVALCKSPIEGSCVIEEVLDASRWMFILN